MTLPAMRVPGIAVLAFLLLASGCKQAQDTAVEAAIEHATGNRVDVEKDGREMTIDTDQGKVKIATADEGASISLPADFPGDVYLPARHTVASVMDMSGMQMVNLTAPQPLAAITREVEGRMGAQGWKREMAMQSGSGTTFMYSKDKREVVYQLMRNEAGGTQLTIRTRG